MAAQRIRQGVRALLAFSRMVEYDLAAHYLNPVQMNLFCRMKRSEQLHSLNVLRAVLAQGFTPDDLAVAALLHDCGKARYPLAVWQKTLVVLLRALTPGLFARLSRIDGDDPRWWKRPFLVAAHHPAWGAELVAKTGASDRALWLIAHHADALAMWHDHPQLSLLQRLKQADDAN